MAIVRKIEQQCKKAVVGLLYSFSSMIPKKKNKWVFGTWGGMLFSDNSKYLFEYIIKEHPEIEAIWITRNKSVLKKVRSLGFKCYMRFSWKGILSALRAEVAFITSNESSDISPFVNRKKTKTIELWHGFGPKQEKWKNDNGKLRFSGKNLRRYSDYYWMATSEKCIDIFHELHDVPRNMFHITGYPRNDMFYYKPVSSMFEALKKQHPTSKFIIYMPTHRNFGKESIDIASFKTIDEYLKKNDYILVYKPHFHELKNILHLEKSFSNIILAKDPDIWGDPYSYIYYFDLMICDYSSVMYDFLCTEKPIVVYAYDIEHYKTQDAGLSDFFFDVPVGPICLTLDETLKEVSNLLTEDTWKEKREKCRPFYHLYNDGKNCERVYQTVISILNKKNS